jgi:serine/threonine protein kinase
VSTEGRQRCTKASNASPPSVPDELKDHPRYEILEVLGAGGMGTVYKARHRLMQRLVALKVVRPSLLNRPEIVARFEREVRLAAQLSHPNIVTAYDAEAYRSLHFGWPRNSALPAGDRRTMLCRR